MKMDIYRISQQPHGYKVIADHMKRVYGDDYRGLIKLAEHLTNGRNSSSTDPKLDSTRIATVTPKEDALDVAMEKPALHYCAGVQPK